LERVRAKEKMKTLILGVGNSILTDDGVGIKIARELKERKPELEVIETSEAGIALLDFIVGYDKLIIIDSIKTEKGKPGELYRLGMEALKPAANLSSSHGIDIATAYEIGQGLGYKMPKYISIYAVEIEDNTTFGEECTGEVEGRIPFIAEQIIGEEKL
jgi:hydrogenase maturation protease